MRRALRQLTRHGEEKNRLRNMSPGGDGAGGGGSDGADK